MDMFDLQHFVMGIGVLGLTVLMLSLIIPEVIEDLTINKLDKTCYQLEKVIYCQSIGMELGSIIVTPSGLFGGKPYNTEACVSETSEKIINYKDVNYRRCLLRSNKTYMNATNNLL